MRRRHYVKGVGISLLATSVLSERWRTEINTRGENGDQLFSDTYDTPGLTTGISPSGDTILFGFRDGNVKVYDSDRDGAVLQLPVDRSVSHIKVREQGDRAVIGWIDADTYSLLDLTTEDGPLIEHPDLWDIATTSDAGFTASVSYPNQAPGSVGLADNEGTILWETPLADAIGYSVAVADDGDRVAVGAAHYWEDGIDPVGQPGIRLYDGDGTELWTHDHDEDVISIDISDEHELVVGGTDDGNTIVLDFEGDVVWQTEEFGGWVTLSGDGDTILTTQPNGIALAIDSGTGEERWTSEMGIWAGEDFSVSDDGSRVFGTTRADAEFVLADEGETIWTESYDVGPGLGALAGDGDTWSTIVTDLDEETAILSAYQTPEPEAAIEIIGVTLDTTDIEIGEDVGVEVTLENTGDADGTQTVELLVTEEVVEEVDVDVAAGESQTVTLAHTFDERGEFEVLVNETEAGTVEVVDPDLEIVVDFDWSYPDCPDQEVGELEQFFFGDLGEDDFHLDDGSGAAEEPDGCVLRTDGDEVEIFSLPEGQEEQPESLEYYPRRGETIVFEHYVHRAGANMEFRFGVQEDLESYYAIRLDTETDPPVFELKRVDEGTATRLDQVLELEYTAQQFHEFVIDWGEEITTTLVQENEETSLESDDDTFDQGGISFYKENTGLIQSYTHLWNTVAVIE